MLNPLKGLNPFKGNKGCATLRGCDTLRRIRITMDRLKDSDSRFTGLEVKIGLLVLSVLVGIAFVVASLGIERGIFTKKYTLYFITESGLSKINR